MNWVVQVSSLILPLIESNRSTTAFSFLIFLCWILILSIGGVFPDFSSLTVTFGLLFVTIITTVAFSSLGVITTVKNQLCGLGVRNNEWVKNDYTKLRKSTAYQRLLDRQAANFFFGLSLLILALLITFMGSELMISIFSEEYSISDEFKFIFPIIGSLTGILGVIISLNSIKGSKRKENERLCYDLIVISRLRDIPRDPDSVKTLIEQSLKSYTPLLTTNEFHSLHAELESTIYGFAQKEIIDYYKKLKETQEKYRHYLNSHENLNGWGISDLFLSISLLTQTERLGTAFFYEMDNINYKHPKYNNQISLSTLLFGKNTTIDQTVMSIEESVRNLRVIDRLFFRYVWFFGNILAGQGFEFSSVKSIYKLGNPTITENKPDTRKNVEYGIILTNFIFNLILYSDFNDIPQSISFFVYDTPFNFEQYDIKIEKKDIKPLKDHLTKNLLDEARSTIKIPFSQDLPKLIENDWKFIIDRIRMEDNISKDFRLPFHELKDTLFYKSIGDFLILLCSLRADYIHQFAFKVKEAISLLNQQLPKTPWRNTMKWLEYNHTFIKTQGRKDRFFTIIKNKIRKPQPQKKIKSRKFHLLED